MSDVENEMTAQFVADSALLLREVEALIRKLSVSDDPGPILAEFIRAVRAIKEPSLFHDLPVLYDVAQATEALLDGLRHGSLGASAERLQALVVSYDFLKSALDALGGGSEEVTYHQEAEGIVKRIENALLSFSQRSPHITLSPPPPDVSISEARVEPSARFAIDEEMLAKFVAESEEHVESVEQILLELEDGNTTSDATAEAFRAMHSLKGNCGIVGLPDMEDLAHNLESSMLAWTKSKEPLSSEKISVLLEALDALRNALRALPAGGGKVPEKNALLSRLRNAGNVTVPDKVLVREANKVTEEAREGAAVVKAEPVDKNASSIRVDTKKLDELMNLVGELIIAETTVTHNPDLEGHEFENFQKAALHLARVTRMLQDVTMQARMVPIESTFKKMARLVRDVAKKQGKEVRLETDGEDTEVDKSVIEAIGDPLVHLMRNAVDHGLEDPAEREKVGKSRSGHLKLDARHQGGEVWISISDDGRGIDPEKILASAIKKGVADPTRAYSRKEILDFIFAPGFSTAEKLTDISGRGVGMDVVKKNIERVNGRIEIETTVGAGTTFTLRIPLTLAIIEGMLVRVGSAYYTIPLLAIRESVRATHAELTSTSSGQELLHLRDQHHPIVKLTNLFSAVEVEAQVEKGILVLVESGDRVAGLLVDEVIGQRQTVIKPLPEYLRAARALSGCSILHNGDISLILDVDALVQGATRVAA